MDSRDIRQLLQESNDEGLNLVSGNGRGYRFHRFLDLLHRIEGESR